MTDPGGGARATGPSIVPRAAAVGFAQGADQYRSARPGYPPEVADVVARAAGTGIVVDLAAGTGKLTVDLVGRGMRVVAIEPVSAMAAHLIGDLPGVPVARAAAERLPLRAAAATVVTVAQAFHWFHARTARAELSRVVRSGGSLIVVFNERDESVDWVARWTAIVVERSGGRPYTPRSETNWPAVLTADRSFELVAEKRLDNPVVTDAAGLVQRAASTSFVAALPVDARHRLLADIAELAATHPDLVGRDRIVFPHTTHLLWCRRR